MQVDEYPYCVFNTSQNVLEQPAESKFFLGETVLHLQSGEFYTVCDLSNYESDYYGLWPVGYRCAVPTHGAYGVHLESIVSTI